MIVFVATGLDPVAHAEFPQAMPNKPVVSMDARVKPGHDEMKPVWRWGAQ